MLSYSFYFDSYQPYNPETIPGPVEQLSLRRQVLQKDELHRALFPIPFAVHEVPLMLCGLNHHGIIPSDNQESRRLDKL